MTMWEKEHFQTEPLKRPLDEARGSAHLRMYGENARTIIINCHSMLRNKFKGVQLWSMVSHITGHGSGYSYEICWSANLDPMQPCGVSQLRDCAPSK